MGTHLASSTVLRQAPPASDFTWQVIAACERLSSVALFAALSPVIAGCAVAVALRSGRAPLIAHRRVGWRGKTLWMLKLRTMWDAEHEAPRHSARWIEYVDDESGPQHKHAADPRVTNWFARFCRRHSIDELPQLWHVIRGEMSLVGPRPVTDTELRRYYRQDAEEMLEVKPGIAGLWQISGRNRLTYQERRDLDLQFVRTRNLRMYIKILLRTIPEVWSGANSW